MPIGPGGGGKLDELARAACCRAASTLAAVALQLLAGSAASTAQSSGPRSRPVSARRSAFRSPPTAFSSRTMSLPSSPLVASSREALQRRRRSSAARPAAARGSARRIPRLDQVARAAQRRRQLTAARQRAPRAPRPTGPRSPRSRAGAAAARSRWTSCAAARAPRGRRAPPRPGCPRRGGRERRRAWPLRELLPSCAEQQPVVDVLAAARRRARAMQPLLELLVRPVVGAADHVRDPEVDGRRRRWRAGRSACRRPAAASCGRSGRAVLVGLADRLRSLAMPLCTLALPHRPLVPGDPEPFEIVENRFAAALDVPRARSVSSMPEQDTQSPKPRLATAESALPRCSEPVGLGAKRVRAMAASVERESCTRSARNPHAVAVSLSYAEGVHARRIAVVEDEASIAASVAASVAARLRRGLRGRGRRRHTE